MVEYYVRYEKMRKHLIIVKLIYKLLWKAKKYKQIIHNELDLERKPLCKYYILLSFVERNSNFI